MENIKINELRIGSLVTIDNEFHHPKIKGVIMEVVSIGITSELKGVSVNVFGNENRISVPEYSQFLKYIKPIPIAEELITKTQLYLKWSSCHRGKYAMFEIDGRLYYYYIDTNTVEPSGSSYIYRYFHELQNLYFALTRNELIIKDNFI